MTSLRLSFASSDHLHMLSAVAARKAAQAAKPAFFPSSTREESVPPFASRPSPSSSKRKPSSQSVPVGKRKKKKVQEKSKGERYFQDSNVIQKESNDILVDSDGDESLDEVDFSIAEFESKSAHAAGPSTQRAWSPSAPVFDSSDEEDIQDDIPDHQNLPSENDTCSTSFRPIRDQNVFAIDSRDLDLPEDTASTLVLMQLGDTLSFIGSYAFSVLQGSVTLLGATLQPSRKRHNVFAPRSSHIPQIKASSASSLSVLLPSRIQSLILPNNVAIVLHELRSNIQGLERVCSVFDGVFRLPRRQVGAFDYAIPGLYPIVDIIKNIRPFRMTPSWSLALSSLSEQPKEAEAYIVQGAKKSGKSTFARTLCNQLLSRYQRIAYLECDLGQSEFTPGGMIALSMIESHLFGPPFTHPSIPVAAHYIGATSPKSSPSHYLAAILACVQMYRLDIKTPIDDFMETTDDRISDSIPLVVNTMGWTKGLGADLLIKIHEIVQPTRIFDVEAPVFDDWPQPVLPPRDSHIAVQVLKPIPQPSNVLYSASDMRSLAILSYFHAVFPSVPRSDSYRQITATGWNTCVPLCAQIPYEVQTAVGIDQVVIAGVGGEDVVSAEILGVLNVALVGLVSCQAGSLDVIPSVAGLGIPYEQGALPPAPTRSSCIGLALIRSVSPEGDVLRILTPTPPTMLASARVLVKGEMELPVWGMLDFQSAVVEKNKVPYLQWDKARGLGAEKKRVRRNLMRKAQM